MNHVRTRLTARTYNGHTNRESLLQPWPIVKVVLYVQQRRGIFIRWSLVVLVVLDVLNSGHEKKPLLLCCLRLVNTYHQDNATAVRLYSSSNGMRNCNDAAALSISLRHDFLYTTINYLP
jgi:hypothetical protein